MSYIDKFSYLYLCYMLVTYFYQKAYNCTKSVEMYNKELYHNNDLVFSVALKYIFECCFMRSRNQLWKRKGCEKIVCQSQDSSRPHQGDTLSWYCIIRDHLEVSLPLYEIVLLVYTGSTSLYWIIISFNKVVISEH